MRNGKPLFEGKIDYCVRCCMPETVEGQEIDEVGICLACRNSEEKMHIDWREREKQLRSIFEDVKKKAGDNYDCIVPISGGKDSTFQMHVLCRIYKMKPLAVTFNHNWYSETGWYNLMNCLEKFNVDHIMFTPNRGLVNRMAKKSLMENGDPCWHCHMGCGSFPLQAAVKFRIPFLVYGESSNEAYSKGTYAKPVEYNREYFLKTSAKKNTDEMECDTISKRDLYPLNLPTQEEYEKFGVWGIHLGNYVFWDEERQTEFVRKYYGWKETEVEQTYKRYKSVECVMPGMHDFTCYLKRGFSRATFHASNDVRNGLLTRDEGFDLIEKFDPIRPEALDYFLESSGMSEEEFYSIMEGHRTKALRNVKIPVASKTNVNSERILPFPQQLVEKFGNTWSEPVFQGNVDSKSCMNGNSGKSSTFFDLSVESILDAYKKKMISPVEVAEMCIRRFELLEPRVYAWEVFDPEALMVQARETERRLSSGIPLGLLEGIPVGIKDIVNTKDFPTQMGSPLWKNFTPGNDARIVHYIREAGGLISGKTVTAEFAVDATGKTVNPHNSSRTPGTSSSGSAAAIAVGMVPVALGTQTGGSIIRPASFCGIYGCKPSFGLIPRTGILKTTDSLDTIGFFALWYRDLQRMFEVLRVRGMNYPIMEKELRKTERKEKALDRPWKVAFVRTYVWEHAEEYTRDGVLAFIDRLARTGTIEIEELNLPAGTIHAHEVHNTIYNKSLAYYFEGEYEKSQLISPIMNSRIRDGLCVTTDEYHKALKKQTEINKDIDEALKNYDVMISISTASEAPLREIREKPDPCLIWTLAHLPAINLPVCTSPDGLPFGIQIVSRRFNDYLLFKFGDHLLEAGIIPERTTPPVFGIHSI